jgi:hypothetical protein
MRPNVSMALCSRAPTPGAVRLRLEVVIVFRWRPPTDCRVDGPTSQCRACTSQEQHCRADERQSSRVCHGVVHLPDRPKSGRNCLQRADVRRQSATRTLQGDGPTELNRECITSQEYAVFLGLSNFRWVSAVCLARRNSPGKNACAHTSMPLERAFFKANSVLAPTGDDRVGKVAGHDAPPSTFEQRLQCEAGGRQQRPAGRTRSGRQPQIPTIALVCAATPGIFTLALAGCRVPIGIRRKSLIDAARPSWRALAARAAAD